MHSNTAIELLKTFSEDEIKKFHDYLSSPYFKKSDILIKIFNVIAKHHPDYKSPVLDKERLYKKIYPGMSYNKQNLKNRMAELTDKIRDFIAMERINNDEIRKKHAYIDELIVRKKYNLAGQSITGMMKAFEKDRILDAEYFLYKLQTLEKESMVHLLTDDKRTTPYFTNLKKGDNLINYFFIYLMMILHDIINLNKRWGVKEETNLSNEFMKNFDGRSFLAHLKKIDYEHYNLLSIYYYMYMTLINDDEENYLNLKNAIFEKFDDYGREDQFNFITFLLNSIYNNPKLKTPKFHREGFEINKIALEKNIFFLEKYTTHFPSRLFWSICNNAVLVKEIDWLEKFVIEYTPKLRSEEQNNMYNYAMAKVHFEKKLYDNSITNLSKIDYSQILDGHDKINLRMMYLLNYYELGLDTAFFSLMDSYKHFLADSKEVPLMYKDALKSSLQYFSVIGKAKFDNKKVDYAVYKKAQLEKALFYKNWLLEKMQQHL